MVAQATQRLESSGMAAKTEGSCQEVRRYLRVHGQNRRRNISEYIHPGPCLGDGRPAGLGVILGMPQDRSPAAPPGENCTYNGIGSGGPGGNPGRTTSPTPREEKLSEYRSLQSVFTVRAV